MQHIYTYDSHNHVSAAEMIITWLIKKSQK